MSSLLRALRSLTRTPGFAVVAIITLALAIASIGTLFAVVDAVLLKPLPFPDAERIIEIGVRMSLGADRTRVLRMILRQGLALVGVGLMLGIVGSLALSNVLASLLYGVSPRDPLVLGAVALVLLVTGALASTVPALRASRVAPIEALRHD